MAADLKLLLVRSIFRTVGRVAPGTTARWAEELFFRPPKAPFRPNEEEFLQRGTPLPFPTSRGTLAGWSWGGSGPTVILIHGWGSRAARFRVVAQALLARGFRVVSYDHPAHGASPGKRTSLVEVSGLLLEVAEQLGPLHAAVGHSLGGAAIAVALTRGLRLDRAVLIAPFGAPPDFMERFSTLVQLPGPAREIMRANIERRFGLSFSDIHIERLVPALSTPALVIHDRTDRDIPLAEGEGIARAWPGARLVVTEGLGHHAIMRDAEVARQVAEFVAGDDWSGGPTSVVHPAPAD